MSAIDALREWMPHKVAGEQLARNVYRTVDAKLPEETIRRAILELADRVEKLEAVPRIDQHALRTTVRETAFEQPWEDRESPETYLINAAHPCYTGDYKTYDDAARLVGDRHSKHALIELVNWLLVSRTPKDLDEATKKENG